jgi:hypothetical protein
MLKGMVLGERQLGSGILRRQGIRSRGGPRGIQIRGVLHRDKGIRISVICCLLVIQSKGVLRDTRSRDGPKDIRISGVVRRDKGIRSRGT